MYRDIYLYHHTFIGADTTVHVVQKLYQNSRALPNLEYFVGFYIFQEEHELKHPYCFLCSQIWIYRIKDMLCQQKFKK
jgi:hypothetical protein